MRYILDTDGYVAYASVENEIECNGVSCTLYSGTVPEGYASIEDWMSEANINAYKIVDGNLVLDSARLAYLEARERSEENDNRHVTAKELYDLINVQSSITEEGFTARAKGNNLLVIDGAGEQVIPKMTIRKVVNWDAVSDKTWNELSGTTATASGTSIDITDTVDAPIRAFKLYGKSTQNGTPIPTTPVDIINVVNPVVSASGNNLSNSITINKTLCGIGDVKDELIVNADGTGKFIRRIGEYKVNGTENIGYNTQNYFIVELESLGGKAQARTSIIADRYPTIYPFTASDDYWVYMRPTGNGFIFRDSRYTTVVDMKNYLKAQKAAGTPLTILYELATPIETELTAEEVNEILSLKTFSPTTVITNDKGAEMEVTYANGVSTWDTIGKGTDVVSQVEIISSSKNILPCLVPSQTLNGLTITQNEDYSFTLDGTATADTELTLAGTTMSTEALFCMRLGTEFVKSGLGNLTLKLYDYDGTDRTLLHSGGNGTITPTESYRITHATLSIPNGTALSEVTISPQIEVGSTATEYVPNKRDYKQIDASMDSGDILSIDNGTVKLNGSVIDYGSNVKAFKDKCVLMVSANSFVDMSYYLPSITDVFKKIKLSADQIDLEGYTTINDGFTIDQEGNVTAKSGTIGDWNISESDLNGSGKCMINNAACNYEMKIRKPFGFDSAISITTDYDGGTTFDIFPSGLQMSRIFGSIATSSSLSGTTLRIGNKSYTSLLDCQPNGAIFYVGDINGKNQLIFDANATNKLHLKGGNALADNGSWVNGSLESRKKEIEEYKAKALEVVKNNKIYSYLYNVEKDDADKHYGFVIPTKENSKYKAPIECISANGDGIDTYSMCAILWKAVQELSTEVEQLKEDKNNG